MQLGRNLQASFARLFRVQSAKKKLKKRDTIVIVTMVAPGELAKPKLTLRSRKKERRVGSLVDVVSVVAVRLPILAML